MRRTRPTLSAFITPLAGGLSLFKSSQPQATSSFTSQYANRPLVLPYSRSCLRHCSMSTSSSEPPNEDDDEENKTNDDLSNEDLPSSPDPDPNFDMKLLRDRIINLDERKDDQPSNSNNDFNSIIYTSDMSQANIDTDEIRQMQKEIDNIRDVWVIIFTNARDGSEGVYSLSVAEENIVLAFQEKEDAYRYSMSLETQDFPSPQVSSFEVDELSEVCKESGFQLGFIPKGALVVPPEESAIDDLDTWRGKPKSPGDHDKIGMSSEEVEMMKKRLESLFGK